MTSWSESPLTEVCLTAQTRVRGAPCIYSYVMAVVLDRSCVRASGRDAVGFLQSMLTNDVQAVADGGGVYALLLTPKARVVADMEVFRVGDELVLACPPQAVDDVVETLVRSRFRKKVQFERSPAAVVWGDGTAALAGLDTPAGRLALTGQAPEAGEPADAWQAARVEAGIPLFGVDFDADVMPAEAGVVDRAISFTKGCYPGQEPVARLHYRGHANRGLRGLRYRSDPPPPGSPVTAGERPLGRTGSTAVSPRLGPIGLAVLRREAQDGQTVDAGGVPAVVSPLPFS
jgi:tRNA-modifying protein YgfZ